MKFEIYFYRKKMRRTDKRTEAKEGRKTRKRGVEKEKARRVEERRQMGGEEK